MLTFKCRHCGTKFQTVTPKRFCSARCQYFACRIAHFGKEQPATYDRIPNHCTMAMLLAQERGTWLLPHSTFDVESWTFGVRLTCEQFLNLDSIPEAKAVHPSTPGRRATGKAVVSARF